MRKTLRIAIFTSMTLLTATLCAADRDDSPAPGGQLHLEKKLQAAAEAPTKGAPATTSCGLLTADFVVTGSEAQGADNDHCFPSDGTGIFGPRSDIPGLSIIDGMDVADMDNDGDNDFLACDGLTGEVYLYTQSPAGVFTPSTVATGVTSGVGSSWYCTNLREADFDGNGLRDFVVGDNRVVGGMFVYLQGPAGTFTQVAGGLDVTWASPTGAQCNCLFGVAAGDVDNDGNDDVMVLGYQGAGAGRVYFYQGNGTGAMAPPVPKLNVSIDFPVVTMPTGLALFDLEGDGDQDLVVGGSADGSHYIYTNDGLGNFSAPAAVAFSTNDYTGIDAYDVDGDLREDLVLVDWNNLRLLYSQNLGGVLAAPATVGTVDAASIGIGAPPGIEREGFQLDHFKCYPSFGEQEADATVTLSDQFDRMEAEVFESVRFCTAVEKTHDGIVTKILDEHAHLEFLRIETEGEAPALVQVNNQFGAAQKLEVGRAAYLAVPTQKIEPGNHPFPKGLDHFACYEVYADVNPVSLELRDQFGFEKDLRAFEPLLLCNPTQKVHDGHVTPITNPLDHLVCYQLYGTEPQIESVYGRNQFGEGKLLLEPADMLCLPSQKTVLE